MPRRTRPTEGRDAHKCLFDYKPSRYDKIPTCCKAARKCRNIFPCRLSSSPLPSYPRLSDPYPLRSYPFSLKIILYSTSHTQINAYLHVILSMHDERMSHGIDFILCCGNDSSEHADKTVDLPRKKRKKTFRTRCLWLPKLTRIILVGMRICSLCERIELPVGFNFLGIWRSQFIIWTFWDT